MKFVDARRLSGHQQILIFEGSELQAAKGQWFLGEDNPIGVSRASRLDAPPPCLRQGRGGEPTYDYIFISRKPQPCLSRLNGMGGELHSHRALSRYRNHRYPGSDCDPVSSGIDCLGTEDRDEIDQRNYTH